MIYQPKNFILEELIPNYMFDKWKDIQSKVWQCFDYKALWTLQRLRDRYGRMRMNNWQWGGPNIHKGYRPPDYKGLSYLSMHKWFRAFDPTPLDESVEVIRQTILDDPYCEDFQYITCIEMNVSWLHFDTRNWDKVNEGILKVYPKH